MTDNDDHNSVRLQGGPEHTASSVEIREDGSLVIEFYDFSSHAEDCFGNDVAYLLFVDARQAARMLSLLLDEEEHTARPKDSKALLLQLLSRRFPSYFELKAWLEANGITFRKEFDSWA